MNLSEKPFEQWLLFPGTIAMNTYNNEIELYSRMQFPLIIIHQPSFSFLKDRTRISIVLLLSKHSQKFRKIESKLGQFL